MEKKAKKIKISTVAYSLIILAFAYVVFIGILIYGFGIDNRLVEISSKAIPYPAAIIGNRKIITLKELKQNLRSVKMFYKNQDFSQAGVRIDFTTDQGKKRLAVKEKNLLNRMIENELVEMLANARGIKISDKSVGDEIKRTLEEYGNPEEKEGGLKRLYGWNWEEFGQKMVKPSLYQEKLWEKAKNEIENDEARNKINSAVDELKENKDFAEIAKKYSEGQSAQNGGDLGWFSSDQMLPEIAKAARSLNENERSGIIESALGYHIIRLESKKTEEGVEKFKIRQIFVRTKTFADWILEQEKGFRIFIPLKNYQWNKEKSMVEFRDKKMREFESNLIINSPDDISVMF